MAAMAPPRLHETELLKRWGNHAEFRRNLRELGLLTDLPLVDAGIRAVATAWFTLGREHLADATSVLAAGAPRAAYSRAYYAVYNVSKSVRFMVTGWVSLKGDDHHAVGKLPDDFPASRAWATDLELLYQHRLRADYDNWTDTSVRHTLTPTDCVTKAAAFEPIAASYLNDKFGFTL